jgi:hypothetical protein
MRVVDWAKPGCGARNSTLMKTARINEISIDKAAAEISPQLRVFS